MPIKKLLQSIAKSAAEARDARIGAVGAQQVRDLYETDPELAKDLNQKYLKANTTGILSAPMAGEFTTYGLIGGGARLLGGTAGSTIGSLGLGALGNITDKKLKTNFLGDTGRLLGGLVGFGAGIKSTTPLLQRAAARNISLGIPKETFVNLRKEGLSSYVARALNRNIKGGIKTLQSESVIPSHNVFRAEVYKGGNIKDPYFSFFTTDPNYAKQYGAVHKYLLEQKGPAAVTKEPMLGSRDIVANDMFINRNGVPNGNVIIGNDAVTSDIPIKSKGIEILSYRQPSTLKIIDDLTSTYHYDPRVKQLSKPISEAERLDIPKGERSNFRNPDIRYKQGGILKAQKGSFENWYKTVPKSYNDTTNYNLRRAYELAPLSELEAWKNDPQKNHLRSVYLNNTGEYEFMKSPNHPTINKELEWFNSKDAEKFRKKYYLDSTSSPWKYKLK